MDARDDGESPEEPPDVHNEIAGTAGPVVQAGSTGAVVIHNGYSEAAFQRLFDLASGKEEQLAANMRRLKRAREQQRRATQLSVSLAFVIFQLREERDQLKTSLSAMRQQLEATTIRHAKLAEKLRRKARSLRDARTQLERANLQIERLRYEQLKAGCLVEIARSRCHRMAERLGGLAVDTDPAANRHLSPITRLFGYLAPENGDTVEYLTGILDETAKGLALLTSELDSLVDEYFAKDSSRFYSLLEPDTDPDASDEIVQEQSQEAAWAVFEANEAKRKNAELRRRNAELEDRNDLLAKKKRQAAVAKRDSKRRASMTERASRRSGRQVSMWHSGRASIMAGSFAFAAGMAVRVWWQPWYSSLTDPWKLLVAALAVLPFFLQVARSGRYAHFKIDFIVWLLFACIFWQGFQLALSAALYLMILAWAVTLFQHVMATFTAGLALLFFASFSSASTLWARWAALERIVEVLRS